MRGGRGRVFSIALVMTFVAAAGLASTASTRVPPPGGDSTVLGGDVLGGGTRPVEPDDSPLVGQAVVYTGKNCYLPGEEITFVLRNVGTTALRYGYLPNFEVDNDTFVVVREPIGGYPRQPVVIQPGENMTWTWDGRWQRADGFHKGELVPRGQYLVIVETLFGVEEPELGTIAERTFGIGDCLAQISAGAPIFVAEGANFTFAPTITITGNANITSVTWDLDPTVDANGDGNATDDIDLVGPTPTYAFGDDGIYPIVMNVRGFGTISSKTRVDQDVVFSIDGSASMLTADPSSMRKVTAKAYAQRLVPYDRGAVVEFRDSAALVKQHHLSGNYSQILADIDSIGAFGGSYLAGGLRRGLNELAENGNASHIWLEIFFTDGESTSFRDRFEIPRAITLAQQLGVPVYTVGVGVTEPSAETILRDIANQTGGRYFPTPDPVEILTILDDIAQNTSQGGYFVVSSETSVTVTDVPPDVTAAAEVNTPPPTTMTLRIAGEKWHDVRLDLLRDGTAAGSVSVVRHPGSPDEQTGTLSMPLYSGNLNVARLVYTPLDDPLNGQVNGATPAWVTVVSPDGSTLEARHTFNVMHPDTWVWEIDLTAVTPPQAARATVTAHVTDPGTDDETILVDWGDGTTDVLTVYHDGVGPDPFPSPWGIPVDLTETFAHAYGAAGTYTVTLTVSDDDGGVTVLALAFDVR